MRHFPQGKEATMNRRKRDGGNDLRAGYGSPLAFAGTLWHRVVINKESSWRVARDLGFQNNSVLGVVRLLKACGYCPSAERLAVAAMIVPDVTDADIAEWWGRDVAWARAVRERTDYWRLAEPFDAKLEYIDDGYQPGDPSPEEIARRCMELPPRNAGQPARQVGMSHYQWNGKRGSFLHLSVE
jgi:hypothetical protein